MNPSIDAHVHLWGDGQQFPFGPLGELRAPNTPATVEELVAEAGSSLCGVLAIQPSQYGYDHRYLFRAIDASRRRPDQPEIRAMPLVDPLTTTGRHLAELAAAPAVAGLRVIARGRDVPATIEPTESVGVWETIRGLGLPVGVLVDPWHLDAVRRLAERFPTLTLVVDHLARIRADAPEYERHIRDLVDLAELPQVQIKISAVDALSAVEPPHSDVWPLIHKVLSAFGPERCLYGTDWPYRRNFGAYGGAAQVLHAALTDAGWTAANVAAQLDATAAEVFGFAAPSRGRQ